MLVLISSIRVKKNLNPKEKETQKSKRKRRGKRKGKKQKRIQEASLSQEANPECLQQVLKLQVPCTANTYKQVNT